MRGLDTNVLLAWLLEGRPGPADFADYLIARDDEAAGCETTLTLDRKAARHPLFTLLDR
jgi:predicted nucleic-acid-binding protein